ncbi:MAG: hypothetical protein WD276_06955 [Actinomycetota bacterium]
MEVAGPNVSQILGEPVELMNSGVPNLPEGQDDEASVVAYGRFEGLSGTMPLVLRNQTNAPLMRLAVSAQGRDAAGNLVASGEDQGFTPNLVPPGGLAIGYVYFGNDVELPAGTEVSFETSGRQVDDSTETIRDLELVEANHVREQIVGSVRNPSDSEVAGPIGVSLMCFSSNGRVLHHEIAFANEDALPPGGSATFNVDLLDRECPAFLAGASGFAY